MDKTLPSQPPPALGKGSLAALDQDRAVNQEEYRDQLRDWQLRLCKLQVRLTESNRRSVVLAVEGPDAAGKGGTIKRIVERLDPRGVRVYSVAKPTSEELARHYLWRFWTKLPARGQIAVFDRSWYGRVLVERVEGFAAEEEWRRAYREINEFERQLSDDGTLVVKLYVHVDKEEQLARFRRREADPLRRWKINAEDWRNREKWDQHNAAAEDMFARTSTAQVPWHLIAGNYKWFARLEALRILVRTIEAGATAG